MAVNRKSSRDTYNRDNCYSKKKSSKGGLFLLFFFFLFITNSTYAQNSETMSLKSEATMYENHWNLRNLLKNTEI